MDLHIHLWTSLRRIIKIDDLLTYFTIPIQNHKPAIFTPACPPAVFTDPAVLCIIITDNDDRMVHRVRVAPRVFIHPAAVSKEVIIDDHSCDQWTFLKQRVFYRIDITCYRMPCVNLDDEVFPVAAFIRTRRNSARPTHIGEAGFW